MLTQHEQLVNDYVPSGDVKLVFWPVLNHSNPSVYSSLTMECGGQQDPKLAWELHKIMFERQSELWGADRDWYVQVAVEAGADQAAFEACYDGEEGLARIQELDQIRRDLGVRGQPYFDVNGVFFYGAADVISTVDGALGQ